MHAGEGDSTGPDRRTVLRGAVGVGAAMVAGAGVASGQEALRIGYHDATANLVGRTLVVYREPEPAASPVCELDDPVRHPVAATAGPAEPVAYADFYVERRYEPGTALVVVDRIQGCERAGTRLAGVFVETAGQPPDESGETGAGGNATAGGDGSPAGDGANATDGTGR